MERKFRPNLVCSRTVFPKFPLLILRRGGEIVNENPLIVSPNLWKS